MCAYVERQRKWIRVRNGIKWKRRKNKRERERRGKAVTDRSVGLLHISQHFLHTYIHTHTHTVTLFEADIVWTKCVEMSAAILG